MIAIAILPSTVIYLCLYAFIVGGIVLADEKVEPCTYHFALLHTVAAVWDRLTVYFFDLFDVSSAYRDCFVALHCSGV